MPVALAVASRRSDDRNIARLCGASDIMPRQSSTAACVANRRWARAARPRFGPIGRPTVGIDVRLLVFAGGW